MAYEHEAELQLVPESTAKAEEESKRTPLAKPTTREPDDDKTGGEQAPLSIDTIQPQAKVAIDEKWLHPLAEFKVEKIKGEFDGFTKKYSSTPVLWNGDVYLTHHSARSKCELLQYSLSNGSWIPFRIPCQQVHVHQLVTYSNLLLVTAGNKLLEFDSCNSTFRNYPLTIPPSSNYGDEILAMTNQDNYLLLVCKSSSKSISSVKLFDGNVWMIREGPYIHVQHHSGRNTSFQAIIHNSTIFILERGRISIHKKSLRSLIDNKSKMWQSVERSSTLSSNLVVLNNNLLIASIEYKDYERFSTQVLCYSSKYDKAWLELGCATVPQSYPRSRYGLSYDSGFVMVAIPDGSLLMMINDSLRSKLIPYTLKPEVHEYDPEKALSAKAVVKLELEANIPISRKFQSPLKLLSKRIMLDHPDGIETMMKFILGWINRWEQFGDCLMPSWSNFYMVLREVSPELSEIADQTEAYLNQYLAKQAKRSPSDQTYLASKLMVSLSSLCSESAVKETVKSGLYRCIEMCDDLSKQDLMKDETDDLSKLRAELINLVSSTDEVEAVRARLKQCVELCDGILQRMRQLLVKKRKESLEVLTHSLPGEFEQELPTFSHQYSSSVGVLPHLVQPSVVLKSAGTRVASKPTMSLWSPSYSSESMSHKKSASPKRLKYSFDSERSGLQHKHSDLHEQRIGLSGVDVHGTTTVVISNSSLEWHWEEFGLKVHVHNDSLPPDINECRISINVSLSGHYEFPENESLVSAVFWFRCDPLCKLAKPVTVEIQHCAPSDNVSNLSFVKAVCTQKERPYTFKHLPGGSFSKFSSFGIANLLSFSGLGITEKGSKERDYLATLLYREDRFDSGLCFHLYFVITWNTAAHYKVMNRFFDKTKMYTNQLVVFESDRVEFRLSTTPGENWTVMSINSYVVEKKAIDNFTPGKTPWIPYSQFKANLSGVTTENVPPFHCTVHLHGAKEPQNQLTIDINPSPVGHGHGTQHARHQDRIAPYSARAKPTLKDLMRELRCKAAFWEDIGVELQIDDGVLAQIQRDKNGNSIDCLREMIRKWLVQVSPTPSWSAIVEAVETIGDEELAKSIKTRFC